MKVLNPNNLPTAPISELNDTQEDLKFLSKENYKKLKGVIEKHGFDLPVTVWIDSQGEKWLLDGHQRKRVLEAEGWTEPIPYLVIKAPNMQSAAERLLQITSQYGTITQEGLDEFVSKFELPDLGLTNFDGIFNFEIEAEPDFQPLKEEEKKDNRLDKLKEIQCPECGYHGPANSFGEYNDETLDS